MKNLIGTVHCGYRVIKQTQITLYVHIVLAYNENKKEWVSWRVSTENEITFYCGHYTSFNETKAILEFYERISKEIDYQVSFYMSKLTYEIRNLLY